MRTSEKVAVAMAELFRAVSHRSRVLLLDALVAGERPITELAELNGLEASHVSQQVGVLRGSGLVSSRRVNSTVLTSLQDPFQLLAVARTLVERNARLSERLVATLACISPVTSETLST